MDCSTQFIRVYSSLLVRRRACVSLCLFPLLSVLVSVLLMTILLLTSLCVPVCLWVCLSGSFLAPVFLSLCMSVPLGDYVPVRLWMCLCCNCWWLLCMAVRIPLSEAVPLFVWTRWCVCVCVCVCVCICERSQRRSWWIPVFHNLYKLVRRLQAILPILNLSLTDKFLVFLNLKHSYYILNSTCN